MEIKRRMIDHYLWLTVIRNEVEEREAREKESEESEKKKTKGMIEMK